jgi:hypothetical protein
MTSHTGELMSDNADISDSDRPGQFGRQTTPASRRRGKVLVPGVVLGVILGIFTVILLVTQCGGSSHDVGQGATRSRPAVTIAADGRSPLGG